MKSVHYNVSGLANSESRTKLNNSLSKIEGVNKVCVDVSRGSVEVKFNEPATAEVISDCICNTGYSIE
ncbi:MAG: heavy metal transporter [Clostridium sp.]